MSPRESDSRPAGNGPATKSLGRDTILADADPDSAFLDGVDLGTEAGYAVGWRDGYERRDFEAMLAYGIAKAAIGLPTKAELAKRRMVDHRPCPRKCRRCSKCVHSLAYWARGGRDYLGVEAEAELARVGAA